MKNGVRYCPSCGRKTQTNNRNPKTCPTCGQSMTIILHPKVADQLEHDLGNPQQVLSPTPLKNKD